MTFPATLLANWASHGIPWRVSMPTATQLLEQGNHLEKRLRLDVDLAQHQGTQCYRRNLPMSSARGFLQNCSYLPDRDNLDCLRLNWIGFRAQSQKRSRTEGTVTFSKTLPLYAHLFCCHPINPSESLGWSHLTLSDFYSLGFPTEPLLKLGCHISGLVSSLPCFLAPPGRDTLASRMETESPALAPFFHQLSQV